MGKRGSAKQGRIPISNVPYGYCIGGDGRPEVVEAEAEVVRRVYRMYVRNGKGAPAITRQLNADGVPLAKEGKRWYDGTIHRILSNETYKGTWWYGKARYVSTEEGVQVYDQPEEEWIAVPFPPLVDEETWEKARVLRRKRWTKAGRNTKVFLPVAAHDEVLGVRVPHGRLGEHQEGSQAQRQALQVRVEPSAPVLQVLRLSADATPVPAKAMIRAERLESLVWGEVKNALENPGLIVAGIEAMNAQEDGGALAEETAGTERDLQGVQMEEDRPSGSTSRGR